MKLSKKVLYPLIFISSLTSAMYLGNKEKIDKYLEVTNGKISDLIEQESELYQQDPNIFKTCVLTESFKKTNNIFQFKPATYIENAKELYHAGNTQIDTTVSGVNKITDNIKCGTKHLSRLLNKYNDVYNVGSGKYKKYHSLIDSLRKENNLMNLNNNQVMALISYNRGEGNMGKWLKEDNCDYKKLPKITQDYLSRASRNLKLIRIVN